MLVENDICSETCPNPSLENIQEKLISVDFGRGEKVPYDQNALVNDFLKTPYNDNPNKIALTFENQTLTYQDLDQQSDQLCYYLENLNIKSGDRIAFYLDPGFELFIGLLAVLKLGCCYVPIGTHYPLERINFILNDSKAILVFTTNSLQEDLKNCAIEILNLSKIKLVEQKNKFVTETLSSKSACYLLYTSGSTGNPIGVIVSHRAVNNHMTWMQHHFEFSSDDVFLLRTPLAFDPSIWEILLPLYIGAKVVIAPSEKNINPRVLVDLIIKNKITVIQFVPTLLLAFLQEKKVSKCISLKHIFCGGETLTRAIKILFFHKLNCQLHNLYGPTETTIQICAHTIENSEAHISHNIIGKPIYNTQLWVINEEKMLCAIDEIGELFIGGDCLSEGYDNLVNEQAKNFISVSLFGNSSREILYKTGDLVRWLENGQLEYIGRNDSQIKLNGKRVEISEIENCLQLMSGVLNSIVLEIKTHENQYLISYLTTTDKRLNSSEIKGYLKKYLPYYMVPKFIYIVDSLPLTENGKIDRKLLINLQAKGKLSSNLNSLPQTLLSNKLFKIWKNILNISNISIKSDFFELGGNSFSLLKLLTIIEKKFQVKIKLKDLLINHTFETQLKLLQSQINEKRKNNLINQHISDPLIALKETGEKKPLFLVHPVAGTIFWYSSLAQMMSEDRPLYGLQDPGIDMKTPIFNNFQEMADYYVKSILKVQSSGPFLIGGASFGATVAIEMARILQKQEHQVQAIIILDGWAAYPKSLNNTEYFRESMIRQHDDLKEHFKTHGLKNSKYLFDLQWNRLNWLWNYEVRQIDFPIILYKAKELLPIFEEIESPFNHWNNYASNIEKFTIEGNHESMFYKPHVIALSEKLNSCLSKYK